TYRKAPVAIFDPALSQVLLGCRHGKPSGNHGLRGRIYRARLYDRALTPEEIAKTATIEDKTIRESDILTTLTEPQRQQLNAIQSQRNAMNQTLEASRTVMSSDDPKVQAWTSLAQSLINLKEFIFLQ
ncbi:MAG: hypothetical protein ACKO8Z_02230, partial [Prosthecobacter sp.]